MLRNIEERINKKISRLNTDGNRQGPKLVGKRQGTNKGVNNNDRLYMPSFTRSVWQLHVFIKDHTSNIHYQSTDMQQNL